MLFKSKERLLSQIIKLRGDNIKILLSYPPHENLLVPEDLPIEIFYEDQDVIVVNKAAGMVVHPGYGNY